jgi:xylulokinase
MMENPLLLGIDIGTSACKVALFAPDGTVVAQASGAYAVFHPAPGWAEQNPDDWWHAVCRATKAMLEESAIDPHRLLGIGIDGQSWSAIPVSKDGTSLCNTPIWMDTRAAAICEELDAQIGAEKIFAVCGNPLQPTYTLPKILWYKRERPAVYEKADKMLQSNAYIAYKLTGEISQDNCQAFGLHVFDTRKGTWDEALCKEMGLRRSLLPEPVPCHTIVGKVTPEAAGICGLCAGIPVVAGGLDAACGALGAGVLRHGETQEQGGQAGGMSICLDRCHTQPTLILSRHVVPDRWLLQGGTVGGGGIMRWLQGELWPNLSMRELDEEAAQVAPGSDGLVFLPYMAGERSPIWDPQAKGVYYGLDYQKTRGHMIRASLEGAAFALRHNLEVAESAGARVERLRAMGGAANSRLWTQIKADITGKPIDVPSSDTATTLGAAMLAGVATGVYKDFDAAVAATVKITRTHEPERHAAYDRNYRTYRELYENLRDLMRNGVNT